MIEVNHIKESLDEKTQAYNDKIKVIFDRKTK